MYWAAHKLPRRVSALWYLLYECVATVHDGIKYFGDHLSFHTSFLMNTGLHLSLLK